jgi:hypothetical protein
MRFPMAIIMLLSIFAIIPHAYGGKTKFIFGSEIQVKGTDTTGWEENQDMCVDSNGYLYVAWENASLTGSNHGIAIYRSLNGGLDWGQIGFLYNADADLRQPSIAVGEGLMNRLIVAYLVDEGTGRPYPEAAYSPLGSTTFVTTPLPTSELCIYSAPEVWTDASQMNLWRAYIVCSEINVLGKENSLMGWRSELYGTAWEPRKTVMWGSLSASWSRPHAAFGTPSKKSFIICCRLDLKKIYMVFTPDFGATYSHSYNVATLDEIPSSGVNPQIAAARNLDHLMVCFTESPGGWLNEIRYTTSFDHGSTWATPQTLPGSGNYDRLGPELTADEFGGKGMHLTYTKDSDVYHLYIRQDFSGGWKGPHLVCGDGYASHANCKKGIACHPKTDEAFICWCDTRDNPMIDTDTFFNYSGSLVVLGNKLSASTGGASAFHLYAGKEHAGRNYLILGSVTGMSPGTPLPGGKVTIPINWDSFTELVLSLTNTTVFKGFYDTLNHDGEKTAILVAPPLNPAYVGVVMHYAYCLNNPFDFTSNAVGIEIVN